MPEIRPETVSERLDGGDPGPLLLDIRDPESFADWHIPGSENVDVYDELKEDPDAAADDLRELPRDREIVTVCAAGTLSARATDVLRELGYDARTLVDGMQGWARVHRTAAVPADIDGELVQVGRPGTGCLSYVVVSGGEAVVIDPSQYTDRYEAVLDEHDASLAAVLETHAHADHVSGARELAAAHDAPYYLHPADAGDLDATTDLADGQRLAVGSVDVDVIHTPGHTGGSVTFDVGGEALLTGDTLFLESVGRPDLEDGDEAAVRRRADRLYGSLQPLLDGADDALVLPAHHPGSPDPPETAPLRELRASNDLLGLDRATFVDVVTADVPETPPNHEEIKAANVGRTRLDDEAARELELGPNQCAAE